MVTKKTYQPSKLINTKFRYPINKQTKGIVCCSDVDKTYLDTKFEKLSELLKIPLEKAKHKKNMPGIVPLLRGLKQGSDRFPESDNHIFFVSASPTQLRSVIEEKMALDQIIFSGTIFKNQLYNIRKREWDQLRNQLGYKLAALLLNKLDWAYHLAQEIFFGDSRESDILIYALYNEIITGQITPQDLTQHLTRLGFAKAEIEFITVLAHKIIPQKKSPIKSYYILLVENHPHEQLERMKSFYGAVIIDNYFESALHLYQQHFISLQTVCSVGRELIDKFGYTRGQLTHSLKKTITSQLLSPQTAKKLLYHSSFSDLVEGEKLNWGMRKTCSYLLKRWVFIIKQKFAPKTNAHLFPLFYVK